MTLSRLYSDPRLIYPMSSSPRGLALIINNIEFTYPDLFPYRCSWFPRLGWDSCEVYDFFGGLTFRLTERFPLPMKGISQVYNFKIMFSQQKRSERGLGKPCRTFHSAGFQGEIFFKGYSVGDSTLKDILPKIEWVLTTDFYEKLFLDQSRLRRTSTLEGPTLSGCW